MKTNTLFPNARRLNKNMSAASLQRRKHGLEVPIYVQMSFILINIRNLTLQPVFVLDHMLYINYFTLAIDPFLA